MRFSFDRTAIYRFSRRSETEGAGKRQPLINLWAAAGGRKLLAGDALDLADRVGLAVDGQHRRRLGQVDRRDDALDIRRDGDIVARAVHRGGGHLVLAVGPLRAVIALAV